MKDLIFLKSNAFLVRYPVSSLEIIFLDKTCKLGRALLSVDVSFLFALIS